MLGTVVKSPLSSNKENVLCIVCFFSVFWDLYCAAPERRETCDHSSEAKAFHDYGFVNSGYSVNGIPHVRHFYYFYVKETYYFTNQLMHMSVE